VRDAIKAIEKSSSYSANEYLPEPEIEDMRHTPGAIRELNKDIEKRKREWLRHFEFKLPSNVTSIPPSTPRDVSHFETPLSKYVCLHIMNRSFAYHFTKMIAEQTFFADYYTLARYSNRTALFETFAGLNEEQEVKFDSVCQVAVLNILPSIAKMLVAAEKHALAVEAEVLKQIERRALGKRKKKGSSPKPPEEVFETACFSFIQHGNTMKDFMDSLPASLGSDRLFSVLIVQSLFRLCRDWVLEAMNSAPDEHSPSIPKTDKDSDEFRVLVSIDKDSEVHRFVASAVCTEMKWARSELKRLTKKKERSDSLKKRKKYDRKVLQMESRLALLKEIGIRRDEIPERHDRSYDSPVLEAMNQGGLLYVAPKFLGWAKELMANIRASITKELIYSLGEEAQIRAYEHVEKNSNRQAMFYQKVKELSGKYDDKLVHSVRKRIVDYAFHARSNVEWTKYKRENTDRTAGKEKKMGRREILKGGKGTAS
jgi:hypothetical protein